MSERGRKEADPALQAVIERLGALGRVPVDPVVQACHLTAMAGVRRSASRLGRVKLAAAFAAGLVLGGTGLASAGVLGETPQNTVADVAAHIGINLPGGTTRATEGCDGTTYENHGQFVRDGGDPHAPCGKPTVATTAGVSEDDGCRPPWAGKGNQGQRTPEAMAAHRAQCEGEAGGLDDVTPGTVPSTVPSRGRSEEAPGHSGAAPGKSAGTPGQSGSTPGRSHTTPGPDEHGKDAAPGVEGQTPGQSGSTPGQSGSTPGQSGTTPGQSGSTPGQP